jgi:hypothetical protein
MRPEPIKITLSDKDYTIRPLTLGQIRKIDELMLRLEMRQVGKSIAIIAIALERDYAATAADIENQEHSMMELGSAVASILTVGGMIAVSSSGESPAAQVITGTASTES